MDFFTGSRRRRSTRRRSSRSSHHSSGAGRVMNMTSASDPQLRALNNMMSRGPLTLVLVYSPSCPHCHTYMPMWKELCKTQGRRANLVSMKADVYDQTPLSEKKRVTGVPSVLYVDTEGRVTEAEDIRNQPLMRNVVKTASPSASEEEPAAPSPPSEIFKPAPAPTPEPLKPVVPMQLPPAMPVYGSEARENPLEPIPALPVQQGGSPWAAFLMSAARQAAPAAALLGAYAALPKRSSGLPDARRRSSRRRRTRKGNKRRHQ